MRNLRNALLCLGALVSTLGFAGVARADCFDDAYVQYTDFGTTSYSVASKRSSDLQILYSYGVFAAESASVFRSGPRGGTSWTPYNMGIVGGSATAATMYVKLNFTARTLQVVVPGWSYNQTIAATCSGGVIQANDGLNTWLMTLKGSNPPD